MRHQAKGETGFAITVNNDRASMRAEGFRAVLAANGLKLPPYWLIERPYDINEGGGSRSPYAS
ncbi:MAG: hypothetical protein C0522_03255 [Rhodocyclaceae bacterium]|nr:hypothetical protein [Rhodocyclaceae bacterium]